MKKIFSLFLVMAMIFTLAFSVSADALTTGVNVDFVENEAGLITATVSAVDLATLNKVFMGIKYDKTKVTLLNADASTEASSSNTTAIVSATNETYKDSWTKSVKMGSVAKSNTMLYVTSNDSTTSYPPVLIDCTTNTELYKLYFKKIEGKTIDSETFAPYYAITTKTGYQQNGQNLVQAAKGAFGFTVTPYTATEDKWQDTIDTALPKDDVIKFPATKDKIGGTEADLTADDTAKKVVIFAKNTSSDALVGSNNGQTANYGITIGGMFYPGFLDVPVGANWSIILVDPDGTLTAGKSYTASATVGSETKPLSNVSFE